MPKQSSVCVFQSFWSSCKFQKGAGTRASEFKCSLAFKDRHNCKGIKLQGRGKK